MKTRSIRKNEIKQECYLVDISGIRLGRAAVTITKLLIGKNKINRVGYVFSGDKVIVINAKNIDIYPTKREQKKYYSHSGYPGGFKEIVFKDLLAKNPARVIESAVWGMLPKTKQGRKMFKNLRVYNDLEYKEVSSKPKIIKFE